MTKSFGRRNSRILIISVALILVALPLLGHAHNASPSISVVNNSSKQIRHVYLSHVDADDWSSDKLSGPISSGQSATVTGYSCDQQQIKVIGEDQDGCFLSAVVACGGDVTWTITNETAADCGH